MTRAKKSKQTAAIPFWKRLTLGERVGTVLAVLAIVVGVPSFFKDCRGNQGGEVEEVEVSESSDSGCGFPARFVRDTLYVLITRFEDFENENDTECWGRNIERKIDELVQKRRMPVRFCYRDDVSPNQSYEADRCRDQFHADLVIWGKLKNAGPDCTADELCLEFEISDTLTLNAGGVVKRSESKYETDVSSADIQKNLFSMNGERFDKFLTGMFDLKIGKYLQAVQEQFQEMFAVDESLGPKKKAEAYVISGDFKASLGRYVEAIADYDKAIAIDPKYAAACNNRGDAKSKLGRPADAISDYDQAIAIDPKNAAAYNNRGNAKIDLGHHAEAIFDFERAILIDPKHVDAYNNRGNAKTDLGRHAEAITDFDQAIAIDPKYALAYVNRGVAKVFLGRYSEAVEDCNQSITIDQKNPEAYNIRGSAKLFLGRYVEAIADYNQSIALNSTKDTRDNLEAARQRLAEKNKELRRNYALAFLFFSLVYAWKFKTINRALRRLFTLLSKALKKRLRRP